MESVEYFSRLMNKLSKLQTSRKFCDVKFLCADGNVEGRSISIFQNLNKIRESEVPFNKINIAHDLTKKQKEELQEKIKEAQEKEENDQSAGWPRHKENREFGSYFFQTRKTQGILL